MANNKNPNQKQPGEKKPGEFHYNPGNMSGKSVKIGELPIGEQSDSAAIASDEGADERPVAMVDGLAQIKRAQTTRDRAQEVRRKAEGTASASEQTRLNKNADNLDEKAALAERKDLGTDAAQ